MNVSKSAMKKNDDILMSLQARNKESFSVPEGYFESVGAKVNSRIKSKGSAPIRFVPYYAVAAALAVIIGLAISFGALSEKVTPEDGLCDADYLFYSAEMIPETDPDYIFYSFATEDSESISAQDIVNYLEYIGADVEDFINE